MVTMAMTTPALARPAAAAADARAGSPAAAADASGHREAETRHAAVRCVGLDVGRVRLGVATAEDGVATALCTLDRRGTKRDIQALIGCLAPPLGAIVAVVGLPPEGRDPRTCSARLARAFAARLAATTGWRTVLVDESETSQQAEARLRALGLSAGRLRRHLDAEAAAVILRRYLDGWPAELVAVPAAGAEGCARAGPGRS
jgi:putative Holliday junction resolvase